MNQRPRLLLFWIASLCMSDFALGDAHGIAVCIGLNKVDRAHYGAEFPLDGCVNDAQDLATLLGAVDGFEKPKVLVDDKATVDAVTHSIIDAADRLKSGDLFVLTIAAHGSQVEDLNGDEAKAEPGDILDEVWLLYDRMWIDDERHVLWRKFKPGVRILVIADTCHSGTSVRNITLPGRPGAGGGSVMILNDELASADPLTTRSLGALTDPSELVRSLFPALARTEDVQVCGLVSSAGFADGQVWSCVRPGGVPSARAQLPVHLSESA